MSNGDLEKGTLVYRKTDVEDAENEDIWDDTALIKMYDEMINKTYDSLGEQCTSAQKKKATNGPEIQWHIGDRCMAPYYDDQLWYPAVVKRLDLGDGKCEVLYDVYDELACVDIADLTKRLRTRSVVSRKGRRCDRPSFSHFAIRPSNWRSGGDRQQHRRAIKRCYSERVAGIPEMRRGIRKRNNYRKSFAIFPDPMDAAAFEESVTFGLPRSVYFMRMLSNLRQQKPLTIDDEGMSKGGNTTEETFKGQEEPPQTNDSEPKKRPKSTELLSKTDQSTPILQRICGRAVMGFLYEIPPLVPPPLLAFSSLTPPDDDEALSSMLMSWYMSGYHTGYYQAMRDLKADRKKKVPQ